MSNKRHDYRRSERKAKHDKKRKHVLWVKGKTIHHMSDKVVLANYIGPVTHEPSDA